MALGAAFTPFAQISCHGSTYLLFSLSLSLSNTYLFTLPK